jgi:hypothetical protein
MVRSEALIIGLLASGAPASPAQFDLVCIGATRTYFAGDTKVEPYSAHFRVDLARRQWCESDCGAVRPIAQVQEEFLEMAPSDDSETPRGHKHYSFLIGRTDGHERVTYMVDGPNFYSDTTDATCTAAPFSGFPKLKKKF